MVHSTIAETLYAARASAETKLATGTRENGMLNMTQNLVNRMASCSVQEIKNKYERPGTRVGGGTITSRGVTKI